MNVRRAAVERELVPEERAVIAALLTAVGLPADAWPAVPGLADFLEAVAVARRLARRRRERPVAYAIALREACAPLGVQPATYAKRVGRWAGRWWTNGTPSPATNCPPPLRSVPVSPATR